MVVISYSLLNSDARSRESNFTLFLSWWLFIDELRMSSWFVFNLSGILCKSLFLAFFPVVDSGDVKLRGNVLFSSLTYFDSLRQGLTIGGGESSLSLFSFLFRAVKDVGWWCTRFFYSGAPNQTNSSIHTHTPRHQVNDLAWVKLWLLPLQMSYNQALQLLIRIYFYNFKNLQYRVK